MFVRAGHHLNEYTTGRRHKRLGVLKQHPEHHGRGKLFRFCKIVSKVLSYLARYDGDRTDVGIPVQANIESGFANHIERPFTDDTGDIEFSVVTRVDLCLGIFHVSADRAIECGFGDDAADGTAAIDPYRETVDVL